MGTDSKKTPTSAEAPVLPAETLNSPSTLPPVPVSSPASASTAASAPSHGARKYKIALLVMSVVLIAAVGTLVYICYRAYQEIGAQAETLATLTTEKAALEAELTELETSGESSAADAEKYLGIITKIGLYVDFVNYVYDVYGLHGGFVGLTDAEYAIGRDKAVATGDDSLVAATDNAWNNLNGDPVARFMAVMDAVNLGIENQVHEAE